MIHTPRSNVRLTPNKKKYEDIIEHLWKALAGFISSRILKQLQNGKTLSFGGIKVKDEGCYLSGFDYFPPDAQGFGMHVEDTGYSERYYQLASPNDRRRNLLNYLVKYSRLNEKFFKWRDTRERSDNGRFYIVSNKDSALISQINGIKNKFFQYRPLQPSEYLESYIEDMNAHILEAKLRKLGEYSASASYINDMNTHILEAILLQFLSSRYQRLSGLLS